MAKNILFITGSDTGVGKTYITSKLAQILLSKGKDVAVIKPISTGITGTDIQTFKKIKNLPFYNFYSFRLPLSPYQAALNVNRQIDLRKLVRNIKKVFSMHETVLVEGIGGVLVAISKSHYIFHLASILKIPALLVTTPWLGTMNHTLLSNALLRSEGVDVKAILINKNRQRNLTKYHIQLTRMLGNLSKTPTYGIMPYKNNHTFMETIARRIKII